MANFTHENQARCMCITALMEGNNALDSSERLNGSVICSCSFIKFGLRGKKNLLFMKFVSNWRIARMQNYI